jgi:DhnA family fructose-bisphosphate aldolase class Ia
MDSRTGKKIRLGRIFSQPNGKSLIVAYSHGVIMGPRPGMVTLADMQHMAHALAAADGLMVAPGMVTQLEDAFIGRGRPSLVIHWDYQSFSRDILPYTEGATVELGAVEDAVAAGADAIMTYLYLGYADPEREKLEIQRNARLARACERWGLVLMIEPRSARGRAHPEDDTNPEIMSLYCRISAELGGDLVKCVHPGDNEALAQIIASCPVPVLVAGGRKQNDPEVAYTRAQGAMQAGAAGLVYGRNIYEVADPAAELERYRKIVHGV